ncbi:all trans-polyprenyl-diphosphate synthase PDSS2-like [Anthonomus grandis grandis]|uniref:all trans-polyprenyl-diphosphate synthase PDSS2-like n=1 Tax=Anthonomus grandis grandis TaxID=2921223 RepID=UPI0021661CBF|nr:all trans-polyprenyl-diphosphate synthase PDSS2-like [Anthonomus grandis grandis]
MLIPKYLRLSIKTTALPNLSYSTIRTFITKSKEETVCKKAVDEAEKVVGYPTSFLSLRWLLNDEVANVANHIRKLIGTDHPLLATARNLILGGQTPSWGLIVLLMSKAGGLGKDFSDMDKDVTAGILHSQRVLAEVTEMVRTSNILHNSILNIYTKDLQEFSDLNFGNTLSLLTGDYLLSNSFKELAGLRNQEVNELVSMSLRDMVEAEFIEPRDRQGRPLPAKPLEVKNEVDIPCEYGSAPFKIKEVLGNAKAEWTLRNLLSSGSLLAKSCQAALKLANHPEDFQKLGYLFGRNTALAWQAHYELQHFYQQKAGPFSLVSAPVMFHLQHDPSFYEEILKGSKNVMDCDFIKIQKVVRNGPGIQMTEDMKQEFVEKCIDVLDNFRNTDAKVALTNILRIM